MGFQDPIVGGIALRIPAIRSPNYAAGSAGWTINVDGSAEFNNVTIRGGLVVGGSSLYYSGPPALGNLIASISAAAGTDTYGNNYVAGIATYTSTRYSQLAAGKMVIGPISGGVPDIVNTGSLLEVSPSHMELIGISTGAGATTDPAILKYFAGDINQKTGSATAPRIYLQDGFGNSSADYYLSGSVIKTNAAMTPYTWQVVGGSGAAFKANWSAGTAINGLSGPGLQYRLMPDDTVWIYGLAAAAAGAGAVIFTLPAGYFPTSQGSANIALSNTTAVSCAVNTGTGDFSVSAVNVGTTYLIDAHIPLRNVP